VIGITTAISSRSGGYQGVGFAIPVSLAKWVADQMVQRGSVRRANTPAAKAGLKPGDVIVEFNGQPVNQPSELQGLVEQTAVGSTVPLRVRRDGKTLTISVTCLEQPKNYGMAEDEPSASGESESSHFDKLGLEVGTLTAEVAERLGVPGSQGAERVDRQVSSNLWRPSVGRLARSGDRPQRGGRSALVHARLLLTREEGPPGPGHASLRVTGTSAFLGTPPCPARLALVEWV